MPGSSRQELPLFLSRTPPRFVLGHSEGASHPQQLIPAAQKCCHLLNCYRLEPALCCLNTFFNTALNTWTDVCVSTPSTGVLNDRGLWNLLSVEKTNLPSSRFYYMHCCKKNSIWRKIGLAPLWEVTHQFSGLKRNAGELRWGQKQNVGYCQRSSTSVVQSRISQKYYKAS